MSCIYEALLQNGLRNQLLSDNDRSTFIWANREGIFSICGFLAIYWIAVEVGKYLYEERRTIRQWTDALIVLIFGKIALDFVGYLGIWKGYVDLHQDGWLIWDISYGWCLSIFP
jgi:hypothetical protein